MNENTRIFKRNEDYCFKLGLFRGPAVTAEVGSQGTRGGPCVNSPPSSPAALSYQCSLECLRPGSEVLGHGPQTQTLSLPGFSVPVELECHRPSVEVNEITS